MHTYIAFESRHGREHIDKAGASALHGCAAKRLAQRPAIFGVWSRSQRHTPVSRSSGNENDAVWR